jgi:hypothetical protein
MTNGEPRSNFISKAARYGLEVGGGLVPLAGGLLSAAASAWSDHEQEQMNSFFKHWLKMLSDEMKEKEQTIFEIAARLDLHDEKIRDRMNSPEYQSLLKKAFREWSAAESEKKRQLVRNILANAAATEIISDNVIKMFLDWLKEYSELHFEVIGAVYNDAGITRGGIWNKLGREAVREDSADADLYKLLIRDLSTGGIVRQHVERDYNGNAIRRSASRPRAAGPKPLVSAFDQQEPYELTALGRQFVHYAMTDLPLKIEVPSAGTSNG